ncbi:hypothetical protein J2046_003055 [Rhizobium petrolearium]|uniref:hypothetical protein n=1 Tax=Neorhizobium petrolearium TaxID=515361 RepID=UPI001AE6527E|nr:hypothetical protein [Neorhizobium petrolearium]MBP1844788.1 hypothetical protein [Neorhizobium petrolearium]
MAGKISLLSQIAAVQTVADNNFASWANRSARELQQEHLRAALDTLKFVKAHEADFRAYMAARQGGKP